MRHTHCLVVHVAAVAVLSSIVLFPTLGLGACNDPPDPAQVHALGRWQSHVGGIDSPFLIPGKRVGGPERTTALRGAAVTNADVVTIAFVGSTAPPALLVLANDCSEVDLSACTNAFCRKEKVEYGSAGTPPTPWVSFTAKNFEVNGIVRAGQVRLAATSGSDIPCALTTTTCTALSPQPHVCIDDLVSTPTGAPRTVTALPPPNDFSKLCTAAPGTLPPCAGGGTDLVLALDSRGDLNIPMDWGRIVQDSSNHDCVEAPAAPPCKQRDVKARTPVPAVTSAPIHVGNDHLQSLNADGEAFNPGPLFEANASNTDALELYGTVDKAFSVLRILGCPASNVDCTTRAFDFWSRREPGGPVVITRKSNGKGSCAGSGADCDKAGDCPAGTGPCIGFGGVAQGYMVIPPPPPPTPVPGILWPYVLAAIALVGLALLWYRNQQGGGS
jgi:hypothetical protein